MKNKKLLSILLALETSVSDAVSSSLEELFTGRDLSGKSGEDIVTVTLFGDTASADGAGVTVSDGLVTITADGDYLLSGSFTGSIVIDADDTAKIQIILSDAVIESEGQAAIVALCADKVFLTLAEGTDNSVSATGELAPFGEVNADGAIFSKCDLTVNGTGSLSVTCAEGHGIVSKDDLKIASGTITVDAARQGLSGKDSVSILPTARSRSRPAPTRSTPRTRMTPKRARSRSSAAASQPRAAATASTLPARFRSRAAA